MDHHRTADQIEPTGGRTMPRTARFYDAIMTILTAGQEKKFRKRALELAHIEQGEQVLDVGCGTGTLALLARDRVGPEGEVYGIDATPQMIERARAKANRKRSDVKFEQGLIEDLHFDDVSLDLVLSTLMMHHLPEALKRRGLKEIARVLKPGGRLLIVDFGGSGHSLGTLIHGQQAKRIGDGLAGLVEEAGFNQVETGKAGMGGMIYVRGVKGQVRQ